MTATHDLDLCVVLNAHREGALAAPTHAALGRMLGRAREAGLAVEVVAVLDRGDEPTRSMLREALGPSGTIGTEAARTRLVEVDHGDLGLARNAGVAAGEAPVVTVVDSDNLPDEHWLERAHETVRAHAEPVVVHPACVVTFGSRPTYWPLVPSTDPGFRPGLLAALNYWDAFCMAPREVFEQVPYVATARLGVGPEDWHWNTMTLHRGVPHVLAPRTVLFYRVRDDGLMAGHRRDGVVLPPTPLLRDASIAGGRTVPADEPLDRTALLAAGRRVVRSLLPDSARDLPDLDAVRRGGTSAPDDELDVPQYRLRHADLRTLPDEAAREHFQQHGRAEGRSGRLTPTELRAIAPERFHPDHYRLLNPDLADLTAAEAVTHYLVAGREEPRRARLSNDDVAALAPPLFDPDDYRLLNPDLGDLDGAVAAASHFVQHGLAEGRLARLTDAEREAVAEQQAPWLRAAWAAAHELEALVGPVSDAPLPTHGLGWSRRHVPFAAAYWDLAVRLPDRAGVVVVAPSAAPAADELERRRADGSTDAPVVLLTTGPAGSGHGAPEAVVVVEAGRAADEAGVAPAERGRLLATLLVQAGPRTVVAIGPEADVLAGHRRALEPTTSLVLRRDPLLAFYASDETVALLEGPPDAVVHLASGTFGYSNFGDVLQLKGAIALWRRHGRREPVLLLDAAALTASRSVDDLRATYACRHVVLAVRGGGEPPSGTRRVPGLPGGARAHMVGGGYLNATWGSGVLELFEAYFSTVGVSDLLVSGMQLDEAVVPELRAFCDRWRPVLWGARDGRSLTLAREVAGDRARLSFDDLIEMLDAWAVEPPGRDAATAPALRLGVHLNTSGYVGESAVAARMVQAVAGLTASRPVAVTLVQAYDDERPDVRDTLSSWEAFGAPVRATRLQVVDIAVASLHWQPGDPPPVEVVGDLRQLDLALVSSYHTAMLLHRLGVPTFLLTENAYYAQKAEVFGQPPTVEAFLQDPPARPPAFADERAARADWLREIEPFLRG